MRPLSELNVQPITTVLTDIDDTLTDRGQLGPEAFRALWDLKNKGFHVVPVTGRPAGWCEMIARFWPVDGVIGENGAFYFRYVGGKMKRVFSVSEERRKSDRVKLDQVVWPEIKNLVPSCAVSSDQFCRLSDLSVDYCEDIPRLSETEIDRIVSVFKKHGAQAKVSSIHVNGWFGSFDKLTMCRKFLKDELGLDEVEVLRKCLFIGDSQNDEPMFAFFPNSVGVANVRAFLPRLKSPPTFVTPSEGGAGFAELAKYLKP